MEPTEFTIGSYRVKHDGSYNWVVETSVTRKARLTGDTYEDHQILGYYNTLQDAAKRLYREELKGKGQQNMKGLADLVLQMEDKLERAIIAAIAGRDAA